MRTLKPKLALLLLFLGSLAAQPPSLARDEQPIVPMGALAHAAAALEQSTGAKVLEVRLANAPGAPAFARVADCWETSAIAGHPGIRNAGRVSPISPQLPPSIQAMNAIPFSNRRF